MASTKDYGSLIWNASLTMGLKFNGSPVYCQYRGELSVSSPANHRSTRQLIKPITFNGCESVICQKPLQIVLYSRILHFQSVKHGDSCRKYMNKC